MQNPFELSALPDELLFHVFRFLPLRDKVSLSHVSLGFFDFSQKILPNLFAKHLVERRAELHHLIQNLERQNGGPYRVRQDLLPNPCSDSNPCLTFVVSFWGLHITLPISGFMMMGAIQTFPGFFSGEISGIAIPMVIGMDLVTLGFTALAGLGMYAGIKYFVNRHTHNRAEERLHFLSDATRVIEGHIPDEGNPLLPAAQQAANEEVEAQTENQITILTASIFNYRERQIDAITHRLSTQRGYGTF